MVKKTDSLDCAFRCPKLNAALHLLHPMSRAPEREEARQESFHLTGLHTHTAALTQRERNQRQEAGCPARIPKSHIVLFFLFVFLFSYLSPVDFCPPATQAKAQRVSAATQCAPAFALPRPQTFKPSHPGCRIHALFLQHAPSTLTGDRGGKKLASRNRKVHFMKPVGLNFMNGAISRHGSFRLSLSTVVEGIS